MSTNPKLIILSHGSQRECSSETIEDYPFLSYNLLCPEEASLYIDDKIYGPTIPANICHNNIPIQESISVDNNNAITVPKMKFHVSLPTLSTRKAGYYGIYLCLYDEVNGYSTIQLFDYNYFVDKRTNTDIITLGKLYIESIDPPIDLNTVEMYVWACRGCKLRYNVDMNKFNKQLSFIPGGKQKRKTKKYKKC